MNKPFEVWKAEAEKWALHLFGVSLDDLPDAPFADWWEDGYSPKKAAKMTAAEAW